MKSTRLGSRCPWLTRVWGQTQGCLGGAWLYSLTGSKHPDAQHFGHNPARPGTWTANPFTSSMHIRGLVGILPASPQHGCSYSGVAIHPLPLAAIDLTTSLGNLDMRHRVQLARCWMVSRASDWIEIIRHRRFTSAEGLESLPASICSLIRCSMRLSGDVPSQSRVPDSYEFLAR